MSRFSDWMRRSPLAPVLIGVVVAGVLTSGILLLTGTFTSNRTLPTPTFQSPRPPRTPRDCPPRARRLGLCGPSSRPTGPGASPGSQFKPTEVDVYKTVDGQKLQIAYFKPAKQTSDRPILCFSGSGWKSGDYQGASGMADFFAAHGHPAFAVTVTGTKEAPGHPAEKWPQMLEDAQDAVKWVQDHASRFSADKNHIALSGTSSGGQIALYAALSGTPGVVAVFNYSGPSDLVTLVQDLPQACNQVTGLLGNCTDTGAMEDASPVNQINKGDVPVFICGFANDHVPFDQQEELADKLKAAGVTYVLHESPGAGHGFNGRGESGPATISFLDQDVGG